MQNEFYDRIILGAGIYGLYSALLLGKKGEKILILECDSKAFSRASYINQARLHNGYHYPRSLSTAIKTKSYFERFYQDFDFCIQKDFKKIYATAKRFSWTNSDQFIRFCNSAKIKCEEIEQSYIIKEGMCDGLFETEEYSFDATILREYFLSEIAKYLNVTIKFSIKISDIKLDTINKTYKLITDIGYFETKYLLNTTYASINQIINLLGYELIKIKYEICEIILCKVSDELKNIGITIMDGPFFSLMPFGETGYHSLTSVTFTPHKTSYDLLPKFDCQNHNDINCSPNQLENCNFCPHKPGTAWTYMYALARKYLHDNIDIFYVKSLFAIKPILLISEIDDSRPTIIQKFSEDPVFLSVLSGKINTIYDLDKVLN